MSREELRAWVAETRARQGLPPRITDPTTVARLAALVADTMVPPGREGGADAVA